jgi:hypothetical protein
MENYNNPDLIIPGSGGDRPAAATPVTIRRRMAALVSISGLRVKGADGSIAAFRCTS